MAYWKEWKSLIGGGIGFLILGIFMIVLFALPGASSGVGAGGLNMMQIGILFLVIGIIMLILGSILRKKPGNA
jgi:hypothetical protein